MTEIPEKFPQTPAELSAFIKKYQNRLVRHAFFRLGNQEDAEDIVQEVMIRIYQEKERRREVEQPVSYVFRMVYNRCIDHVRKNSKIVFEKRAAGNEESLADDTNRQGEIIAREEFIRVDQLLRSVPEDQAEVLRLRIIDGMSFVEIAEIMKLPVTTIKSRFTYGIIKLRNKLTSKEEVRYELR